MTRTRSFCWFRHKKWASGFWSLLQMRHGRKLTREWAAERVTSCCCNQCEPYQASVDLQRPSAEPPSCCMRPAQSHCGQISLSFKLSQQSKRSKRNWLFLQQGSMKTVTRAANLFHSFRHMSALLALGTMYLQLWSWNFAQACLLCFLTFPHHSIIIKWSLYHF